MLYSVQFCSSSSHCITWTKSYVHSRLKPIVGFFPERNILYKYVNYECSHRAHTDYLITVLLLLLFFFYCKPHTRKYGRSHVSKKKHGIRDPVANLSGRKNENKIFSFNKPDGFVKKVKFTYPGYLFESITRQFSSRIFIESGLLGSSLNPFAQCVSQSFSCESCCRMHHSFRGSQTH